MARNKAYKPAVHLEIKAKFADKERAIRKKENTVRGVSVSATEKFPSMLANAC